MDYVSANNDYLINFRKIQYRNKVASDSHESALRAREQQMRAARQQQLASRNAARTRVEVSSELSAMKNARNGAINGVRVSSSRVSARQNVACVETKRARSASSAANARTGTKQKNRVVVNTRTAAEFLNYSCEERTYCDTEHSREKSRFPLSFFFTVIGITILFVMLIGSYSQLSEATAIQSQLEKEISSGLQYKTELVEKIDEKIDLAEIERIAINRLGMVKADSSDKGYISIAGEDKIVVTAVDDGANENMSVVMSGVGRLFKNLVNIDS